MHVQSGRRRKRKTASCKTDFLLEYKHVVLLLWIHEAKCGGKIMPMQSGRTWEEEGNPLGTSSQTMRKHHALDVVIMVNGISDLNKAGIRNQDQVSLPLEDGNTFHRTMVHKMFLGKDY